MKRHIQRKTKSKKRKGVVKKRTTERRIKRRVAKRRTVRKSKPTHSARGVRYAVDPSFEFFDELRSLIFKSSPAEKSKLIRKISGLGRVKLAVISGVFLNETNTVDGFNSVADLFIVGDGIERSKLSSFLKALQAEVGTDIRFTLMDHEEFSYRFGMFDRFVRVLLEGPHEKIINKLGI